MPAEGKATRVRIYLKEDDAIGMQRAWLAVLEWLRRERALGATVFRGLSGLGAGGRIVHDLPPELEPPVVVEWIDSRERVERLLPRLKQLARASVITSEEIEIAQFKPTSVRDLPAAAVCADVMSRDVVAVEPDTPLRKVVELVEGRVYRAVPVVEAGKPIGIVTNRDLVARGALLARVELLRTLSAEERAAALRKLDEEGRTAREVMSSNPIVVSERTPLTEAADLMVRKRLKRLPVVDAEGKLTGMVSRLDLLRTVAQGFRAAGAEPRAGLRGDLPLGNVMRKDVPAVKLQTPVAEVLQAVVSTPLDLAVVVDAERRVRGVIGDEQLLVRVTPAQRPSAVRALMHRFANAPAAELEHDRHARAKTASDLMRTDVSVAREDQLLRDAVRSMVDGAERVVVVVDAEGRLAGAVHRADVLRALVQDSSEPP